MNAQHPMHNPRVLLVVSMLLCAALIVGCHEIPVAPNADDVAATETVAASKKCETPPCGGGGGGNPAATIDFPPLPNSITSPGVQTKVEVFKDNATTLALQPTEGLTSVTTSRNLVNTQAAALTALDPAPATTFHPVDGEEVCRLFVPKRAKNKLTRDHVVDALEFFVVGERQSGLGLQLDKQAISDGDGVSDGNNLILVDAGGSSLRSSDILASDVFPEAGAPKVTVLSGDPFVGTTTYRFHAGSGVAKIIATPGDIPNFAVHCRLKDAVDFIVNLNP